MRSAVFVINSFVIPSCLVDEPSNVCVPVCVYVCKVCMCVCNVFGLKNRL